MTDRFTTEAELTAQINDLAIQRRELTGQLVDAGSQVERNRITDEINALGTEQRDIEARVRQVRASRSASHATVLNGVNGAMSMPAPGPTFELYERTRSNSVHGEPGPAVSVTTRSFGFAGSSSRRTPSIGGAGSSGSRRSGPNRSRHRNSVWRPLMSERIPILRWNLNPEATRHHHAAGGTALAWTLCDLDDGGRRLVTLYSRSKPDRAAALRVWKRTRRFYQHASVVCKIPTPLGAMFAFMDRVGGFEPTTEFDELSGESVVVWVRRTS